MGGVTLSSTPLYPTYVTKPCLFYRWILENSYLPKIISTKHSLLYFFRNIRWLSALISTSYGRNPACISPSAFFKSWTPLHQKPWSSSRHVFTNFQNTNLRFFSTKCYVILSNLLKSFIDSTAVCFDNSQQRYF
jgi:hypothetical protein